MVILYIKVYSYLDNSILKVSKKGTSSNQFKITKLAVIALKSFNTSKSLRIALFMVLVRF